MTQTAVSSWQQFQQHFFHDPQSGLTLDTSRIGFDEAFLGRMEGPIKQALASMADLEKGGIANPDENRMVGHYWLRAAELAPTPELRKAIDETRERITAFADQVHRAQVKPPTRERFTKVLSIGIGGSALGPQFVAQALGSAADKMEMHFLDNTDPEGFEIVLGGLGAELASTLTLVISKSGGTPETWNGMLEAKAAYERHGLKFASHAVAITGDDSHLDKQAKSEGWLARFPMWDWVGGRTSVMSAVGLVGMALQGIDIEDFLAGAAAVDALTRRPDWRQNPGALLALAWYCATGGQGKKDMVILPYKDRLAMFSRYLQQLVMESLGKEKDLDGKVVHQGIAVYGNKGSTDQHAYVQQLRDGLNNFYATFIVVLKDRPDGDPPLEVQPGATSGDFLSGFWQGTREALTQNGRANLMISVPEVTPATVGGMIALYERAVGLYGFLVNVNAYHQPGVEAGKKAAKAVLDLQARVLDYLGANPGKRLGAEELAQGLGAAEQTETIFHIAQHLAANRRGGVSVEGSGLAAKFGVS